MDAEKGLLIVSKEKDMKVKKRKKIVSIVMLFFLLIMYHLISPFFILPQEIKELNSNINSPYKFGDSMEQFDLSGFNQEWEEYYYIMDSKKEDFAIGFEGFPDESNEYKLVYYATIEKDFSIFDMHIGESSDTFDKNIRKIGYKRIEIDYEDVTYKKGRIEINIMVDTNEYFDKKNILETKGQISRISININNTDWLGKVSYK